MGSVVLDLESLLGLALLVFVVRQTVEKFIKPIVDKEPVGKVWPFYLSFFTAGIVAWFSELNALPIFSNVIIGRAVSCCAAAHGPAFLHDVCSGVYDFLKNWPKPQE
jgi:hypothetical protein